MTDDRLTRVYGLEPGPEMNRFYDVWAADYDADLGRAGYATPDRIAEALLRAGADRAAPLLDIGCGTGLSGAALARAGFAALDGVDPSQGMRRAARAKGVYRNLATTAEDAVLTPPYATATAAGVIGAGAAPLSVFDAAWARLATGGLFAFSFNDHTLEDPAYESRVTRATTEEGAVLVLREAGAHLPDRGLGCVVYVLRKG